ncbi:MAG: ABC transporter ATP-binding protein [Candidatus Bathyarchaeia archaeon]
MDNILEVEDLDLYYSTKKGVVRAVDSVSFELPRGNTLALVGESGCGKSSLAKAIIRLLPRNIETYRGKVKVDAQDIMPLEESRFRREIRWKQISMVFQGALNSLNPVLKVGRQVAEPLIIHENKDMEFAREKAKEMLKMVGIPVNFVERYPFELSGGMKQRTVIAMALISNPEMIILDEPTSALDVITQANIMNLFKRLKQETDLSFIYITHDIAVSSELADSVAVMYAGEMAEIASAEDFYSDPAHPYSQLLMSSVPTLRTEKELTFIKGAPPSLIDPPSGCRFHPRCPHAMDICKEKRPHRKDLGGSHYVRCWLYE